MRFLRKRPPGQENVPIRIFLINIREPQFSTIPQRSRAGNGNIRVIGFPPLGIMTLSAVLKRAGHECVMFDQVNPETPDEVIIEAIRAQRPALVGLSFLSTTSYPYAKLLARRIRDADARVALAFGGVFATLNAALVKAQCPEVNFICRGDGEQLILDLAERMGDPEDVAGLTWERDGLVRHNPDRPMDRNLDQWPFPDRDGLPLDFLEAMPLDVPVVLSRDRFTTMQTSRGCPWHCAFCDVPVFNEGKWRSRSPEHVIGELKQLQAQGYRSVYFLDDNFLLQPPRIEALCKGINDAGISIRWGCEGRVDSVVQHLFPAMVKARCHAIMLGIESGSQRVLDRLKKSHTLAEVENTVENAKRAGIELVHGFFLVGCPDETAEDIRQTFDFAARLRLDTYSFNRLCVYRGTALWREYMARGLIDDETSWYKYFKCSEIDPTCLSGEEINRARIAGFRRLFLYKLTHYPLQSLRILRRLARTMPLRAILYLLVKPFLGKGRGETKAEVVSRTVA